MSDERWHVRGTPVADGGEPEEWWIAGGRLWAEAVSGAVTLPGAWLAPGMVDAHVHLTFEPRTRLGLHPGSARLIEAQMGEQRRAGVLAVRDAGTLPGVEPPAAPERGGSVLSCGPFLAPPDFFLANLYEGTPPERAIEVAVAGVANGRRWVKLIADFPGPDGNYLAPRAGYSLDLIGDLVGAVHRAGGRVAAHVSGPIVDALVHAGVDSIEHGNTASEATVRAMAARGTAWTPTLSTVTAALEPIATLVPPARDVLEQMRRTLPLAAELGVTLLAGTDEAPPGSLAGEVALMTEYGVPAAMAVTAATTGARRYLGLPGLEDGAPADVVTFDDDPRADMAALARPAAVVCGGRRIV